MVTLILYLNVVFTVRVGRFRFLNSLEKDCVSAILGFFLVIIMYVRTYDRFIFFICGRSG